MRYKLETSICTDVGAIRKNNEDSYYFDRDYGNKLNYTQTKVIENEFAVFGVFDGVGGAKYGELASYIATSTLDEFYLELKNKNQDIDSVIEKYIDIANGKICTEIKQKKVKSIGCTMAIICIKNNIATIFNIGDSRIYIFRNKKLKQITKDHTNVESLIKLGVMKKNDIKADKITLTQYLGITSEEMIIQPYISPKIYLKNKDIFLVCSDGLTNMVSLKDISEIILNNKNLSAPKLTQAAIKNGGKDNITAISIYVKNKGINLFG